MSNPRPNVSRPYSMFTLVSDTLMKFDSSSYRNETVIALLKTEKERLHTEWQQAESAQYRWDRENEQAKRDAAAAAKRAAVQHYLDKMSDMDRVRALDLMSKIETINFEYSPVSQQFQRELNTLFAFYDSI